jgi:hypothetical protein
MAKYVLAYTSGGSMADSPEEQRNIMVKWMTWFGSLGESVIDAGNPFGPACTIGSNGSVSDGGDEVLTGYSIIEADSVPDVAATTKGCPVPSSGGGVEVYEAMPIG